MARPPGTTETKRSRETKMWRNMWEAQRKQPGDESPRAWFAEKTEGKCDGYRYLWRIFMATRDDVFADALSRIEALGLHELDWDDQLRNVERTDGGGSEDDLMLSAMRPLIEKNTWSVKRAAEHSLAYFGCYLHVSNWNAAVQRGRDLYRKYQAGIFLPLEQVHAPEGIWVTPIGPDRVINHLTAQPLPEAGMHVRDSMAWRRLLDAGRVAISKPPDPPLED